MPPFNLRQFEKAENALSPITDDDVYEYEQPLRDIHSNFEDYMPQKRMDANALLTKKSSSWSNSNETADTVIDDISSSRSSSVNSDEEEEKV